MTTRTYTDEAMNPEALKDLTEQANTLAYEYILHSGLYKSLQNDQWDALAEQMAERIVALTRGMVDVAANVIETNGAAPVHLKTLQSVVSQYGRAA